VVFLAGDSIRRVLTAFEIADTVVVSEEDDGILERLPEAFLCLDGLCFMERFLLERGLNSISFLVLGDLLRLDTGNDLLSILVRGDRCLRREFFGGVWGILMIRLDNNPDLFIIIVVQVRRL
jgi:hypothetical protein